jgi:TRAP-type mannitol/chloroaromatic compound transport system substrate-binding protein
MSVTLLPGGELYQALETGTLDGTEFSLPTVDEQLGFYQVADYLYLPGWHQPSTNQYLYINLDVWNGLSEQTQAMINMACMAGNAYAIARAEALQGAVITASRSAAPTCAPIPTSRSRPSTRPPRR